MSSSFEDLDVWKRSCDLSVQLYALLKNCRDYGLKDQIQRASISIASNIAEGRERNSKAEFLRFLNIAKGSAAEFRTQIYVSERVNVINSKDAKEIIEELKIISRMLQAFSNSLLKTVNCKPVTSLIKEFWIGSYGWVEFKESLRRTVYS